jgi:hypothetical protein
MSPFLPPSPPPCLLPPLAQLTASKDIYHAGFDVVYTYNLDNAITARIQVNTANGISPP